MHHQITVQTSITRVGKVLSLGRLFHNIWNLDSWCCSTAKSFAFEFPNQSQKLVCKAPWDTNKWYAYTSTE